MKKGRYRKIIAKNPPDIRKHPYVYRRKDRHEYWLSKKDNQERSDEEPRVHFVGDPDLAFDDSLSPSPFRDRKKYDPCGRGYTPRNQG